MKKQVQKKYKRTVKPPCGLCGRSSKPRQKTECCGNWICGDESDYVLFSYSRNICSRNHRRYTLCAAPHTEEHPGDWQTCQKCREAFEPEMYVWYGTNKYNFEKLKNPPTFQPTYCAGCKKIIRLPDDSYTCLRNIYACEGCMVNGFDIRKAVRID